ncbi:hypothetical protein N9Z85_03515 [Akkermansiaceae bacterium]|nr:hypothetical protein [Akkermansiaceae bacterium]
MQILRDTDALYHGSTVGIVDGMLAGKIPTNASVAIGNAFQAISERLLGICFWREGFEGASRSDADSILTACCS